VANLDVKFLRVRLIESINEKIIDDVTGSLGTMTELVGIELKGFSGMVGCHSYNR
jgi:hypothetical protein